MPQSLTHDVSLARHPGGAPDPIRAIRARLQRTREGTLRIAYAIEGDLKKIRIPRATTPRMGVKLWQHTCCELFIARAGEPAYHELNFSPSGQWAAFAFTRYRVGGPLANASLDPQIRVSADANTLELEAVIPLARVSPSHADDKLSIGVSAVIEDDSGTLSYWALRHAAGKPDFHHPEAFALALDEIRH